MQGMVPPAELQGPVWRCRTPQQAGVTPVVPEVSQPTSCLPPAQLLGTLKLQTGALCPPELTDMGWIRQGTSSWCASQAVGLAPMSLQWQLTHGWGSC